MHLSPNERAVASRPTSHTAVALALVVALLCAFFGPASGASAAPAAANDSPPEAAQAATPLKAVIVVGPTHSSTSRYLGYGESLAQLAESYGMDVRRIFHPNATAERLKNAIQGANLVAYFGHGNGWPSPYAPFQEKTKNGMGLNPYEGGGTGNVAYHGGNWFRNNAVLAENAVVLFGGLCYAEGNGEPGMGIPSWDVARQRVDNFASAFLQIGAGAVYAYGWQSVNSVLDGLMTTDKTVDEIFMTKGRTTSPSSGFIDWDDRWFDSQRMPGFKNHLDPHPQEGYLRAVSGRLAMTAADFRGGTSSGGEITPTPTPAPTTAPPPTTPQNLTATTEPNRIVKLTWQPSTSSVAGTMRYRVFRNSVKISSLITTTAFTDQPAAGTHRYKVRAVDPNGTISADTPVLSVTVTSDATPTPSPSPSPTPSPSPSPTTAPSGPTVPQGLSGVHDGEGTVKVTWHASTSDNSGTIRYRVFRNGKAIGTKQTARSYTDSPVTAGSYQYRVRAIDAAGYRSALASAVTVVVTLDDNDAVSAPDTAAPSVPNGLSTRSLGYRRIALSWTPSSDDRSGTLRYVVFRNGKRVARLTATSFTDRPRYARTYNYTVRAIDAARNRSALSAPVKGTAVRGAVQ